MSVWHPPWLCLHSLCWQQLLSHWRNANGGSSSQAGGGEAEKWATRLQAAQNHKRPKSMFWERFFFFSSFFFFRPVSPSCEWLSRGEKNRNPSSSKPISPCTHGLSRGSQHVPLSVMNLNARHNIYFLMARTGLIWNYSNCSNPGTGSSPRIESRMGFKLSFFSLWIKIAKRERDESTSWLLESIQDASRKRAAVRSVSLSGPSGPRDVGAAEATPTIRCSGCQPELPTSRYEPWLTGSWLAASSSGESRRDRRRLDAWRHRGDSKWIRQGCNRSVSSTPPCWWRVLTVAALVLRSAAMPDCVSVCCFSLQHILC